MTPTAPWSALLLALMLGPATPAALAKGEGRSLLTLDARAALRRLDRRSRP